MARQHNINAGSFKTQKPLFIPVLIDLVSLKIFRLWLIMNCLVLLNGAISGW